jgi:hypothetical protein
VVAAARGRDAIVQGLVERPPLFVLEVVVLGTSRLDGD